MTTKTCTNCGKVKPLEAFSDNFWARGGVNPQCKDCVSAKKRAYYALNLECIRMRARTYYLANKERIAERNRTYYLANKVQFNNTYIRSYILRRIFNLFQKKA